MSHHGGAFLGVGRLRDLGHQGATRWAGWAAWAAAILNLVAAPAIYAGSGPTAFYTANGYVLFLGVLSSMVWLFIAVISMVLKREAVTPMSVHLRWLEGSGLLVNFRSKETPTSREETG